MKEYSVLNMGIIGYVLFKCSVGNVWGFFVEFEIIYGSRLLIVFLSYEDVLDLIKFFSIGIYVVNYLIFCSCVVFVIMNKVLMNEKIFL